MEKATYALVVQTLLLVSQVQQVQPAAGDAIKKKYWTALCDIAVDADKIAAKALHSLQQPAEQGTEGLRNLLRALVYNLANNTEPTNPGERMIWSHFAQETSAAIDFYKGDKPAKLITAVRDAARTNGAILDWINTQHAISTAEHGCLSKDSTGGKPTEGTTDMARIEARCVTNWSTVTAAKAETMAVGQNGLRQALGEEANKDEITGGANKCNSNSEANAVKLLNGGEGTKVEGQAPTLVAGIFKLTTTGMTIDDLSNVESKQKTDPYVYHIVQAVKTAGETLATEDVSTLERAKTSQAYRSVARVHLLGTKPDDKTKDEEIPDKIETEFGNQANYTAIFRQNIDEMPLTKELKLDPDLKKLGEITDISDLMRLYFFFSDRQKRKLKDMTALLEEAKRNQPPKSTEDKEKECNAAGDDKTECGKKPGCTYDAANKKCTLSEEAKQAAEAANQETGGKDGKPTNTTGSNSVLINKAPILLAVLLF